MNEGLEQLATFLRGRGHSKLRSRLAGNCQYLLPDHNDGFRENFPCLVSRNEFPFKALEFNFFLFGCQLFAFCLESSALFTSLEKIQDLGRLLQRLSSGHRRTCLGELGIPCLHPRWIDILRQPRRGLGRIDSFPLTPAVELNQSALDVLADRGLIDLPLPCKFANRN